MGWAVSGLGTEGMDTAVGDGESTSHPLRWTPHLRNAFSIASALGILLSSS